MVSNKRVKEIISAAGVLRGRKKAQIFIERIDIIKKCIDLLSEEQRLLVLAYYYDNMSIEELSDIFGVSETNIKSRLHFAREWLEEIADNNGDKNEKNLIDSDVSALILALYDIIEDDSELDENAIMAGYEKIYLKKIDFMGEKVDVL